jgi:hypothetical protein
VVVIDGLRVIEMEVTVAGGVTTLSGPTGVAPMREGEEDVQAVVVIQNWISHVPGPPELRVAVSVTEHGAVQLVCESCACAGASGMTNAIPNVVEASRPYQHYEREPAEKLPRPPSRITF